MCYAFLSILQYHLVSLRFESVNHDFQCHLSVLLGILCRQRAVFGTELTSNEPFFLFPLPAWQGLHSASIPGILSLDLCPTDSNKVLTGTVTTRSHKHNLITCHQIHIIRTCVSCELLWSDIHHVLFLVLLHVDGALFTKTDSLYAATTIVFWHALSRWCG